MKRWFARQPIHRKLITIALVVTAAALILANLGLIAVDLWRYRAGAIDEATSTARVIAENTVAAVTFADPDAATASLATVAVRPTIRRACLYLSDGSLFAGYGRSSEFSCERHAGSGLPWDIVVGTAEVSTNNEVLGSVYVERDLGDLWTRIAVAGLTGLVVFGLAGMAAFAIAYRLQLTVSAPIAQLAAAARTIRPDGSQPVLPDVAASEDEIGDLVRAFTEMLRRIRAANAERERLLLREREASRLKDEFLAAVSHELRTPLNAMLGWVQILTTTAASEQTTAKAIASIARNAKAQTRVIEDLVDVSSIVAGKLTLRTDQLDLRTVVESAVEVIRPVAQTKNQQLVAELPDEPCMVFGDRDRLQQIVWNLLSNAAKFTPVDGRITVRLLAEKATCEIEVSDTGIGITPAFLPHVFDRFRQADGSMTRQHGGLGLGLAIVKELTDLHHGSVTVRSDGPDKGATFVVRLPRLDGRSRSVMPPPLREPAPSLEGIRVLAVDDNVDALDVLATSLAALGARVRTASSGEAALRLWNDEPADLVICDLAMPRVNGFDVLREVRARDEAAGHHTAAIALTAHASEDYQTRTKKAGFDAHVAKPYDFVDLEKAVVAALERRH